MLGRQRHHHRLGFPLARQDGSHRDGRSQVAPVRLEHDGGLDPELLRLVAGEEAEVGRGHHDGAANRAASATRISAC